MVAPNDGEDGGDESIAVRLHGEEGGEDDELCVIPGSLVYRVKARCVVFGATTAAGKRGVEEVELFAPLFSSFNSNDGPRKEKFDMAECLMQSRKGGRKGERAGCEHELEMPAAY